MRRQFDRPRPLVIEVDAPVLAGPFVGLVGALLGPAQIDEEAHVERLEPRDIGLGRIVEGGRAVQRAAREPRAVYSLVAAKVAEVQDALEIDQPVMHGIRD
jgi:hypothetical protein